MAYRPKLTDVFPDWMTGGGIFAALDELEVPWAQDDIADSLDLEYFGNISGDKFISPLVDKIMTGDELTSSEIATLANVIFNISGVSWAKEYATRSFEYDPIENYSMTETMTNDETVIEYGRSVERTDDLTNETTPDLTAERSDSIYGFNSTDALPTGGSSNTTSGTNTETQSGTVTTADSGSDTHTRNYTLTRSGNIGVTTAQQMITSERDLWKWDFFRDVVFPDINKVLALSIY